MTVQAVRDRTKTVTRRRGWWENKYGRRMLLPGDRLTLVLKSQGRKPGEPLVRLAEVEVVAVRREPLNAITAAEVALEGFPGMSPAEFVRRFFVEAQDISPDVEITRIEWTYMEDATAMTNNDITASKYEVGRRIRFPLAGHVYRITAVTEPECTCEYPYEGAPQAGHHPNCDVGDESQRRVRFASPRDPEDWTTETVADLDRADVTVLP
ncbi:MAG TPA: hypothetical protein VHX38_02940 [Pseudonocardiaceae bacterium]|nr:hypothetical protein [Pseudonocardiaceae bacterium]